MMNTAEFDVSLREIDTVLSVKRQVDQVYQQQSIFGLSLETLELSRRFNNAVCSREEMQKMDPVDFNRLMILTRHLERNLVRETV